MIDDDTSIGTLVGRLVEDARGLAGAEIALVKARAGERIGAYRNAIVLFAIAGVLALATLIAMLVGLILSLATLVGPGFATLIVVVVMLVIAGALAFVGKRKLAPPKLDMPRMDVVS